MATPRIARKSLSWKLAAIGGVFALLLSLAVAAIIYRSPDVKQDQTIYPLGLTVSPNPFPGIGLDETGSANFTLELTVTNSNQNPNVSLEVFVQPGFALNLSISHCLENSQPNLTGLNSECSKGEFEGGGGSYFANVTSGSSVMLRVQVGFEGAINEPVLIKWNFFAVGTEIP